MSAPLASTSLRPERALLHPAWIASLALLVANDHLFKGSGILPALVTGKLSDFAGMLVAPALLATLLRVRTTRGVLAAHIAVGFVFSLLEVSPVAARRTSATWVETGSAVVAAAAGSISPSPLAGAARVDRDPGSCHH